MPTEMDNSWATSAESRKLSKPLMEKRRRARINSCLQDLKALLYSTMRNQVRDYHKLEKADILELTVKYIREQTKITDSAQYRAGFHQCASHIGRYSGVSPSVRARLAKHLRRSHATSTQATANDGKSDVDREGATVEEMKEELRSPAASPVAMDTTRETNATPPSQLGSVSSTHVNITSSPRVVPCEDHGEVPLKEYTWREQAGRDGVAATRLESGEVVLVFPTEAGSRHNMLFNSGLATPPSTPPSSPDHRTNEQGSMVFANVESVYAGQSVWRPW